MDLIFTRPNMEDAGVLHNYEFDLAFGSDENNFECVVDKNDHCCDFGSFLYIEGTEYGGIIDGIEIKNSTMEVVYSGRTWHGILNSKVIEPDNGQAYLVAAGEANEIIASLLSRLGLTDLFEASIEDSGLTVKSYKMNRYITGYDGIRKMLKTVGGKLIFTFRDGKVLLTATKAHDYSQDEELDSDVLCLDVKQTANTVNHLICLGSGNLEDRMVIHLYADENGNISQAQTFSGLDEHVAVFDYGNAEDEADLLKEGTDRLKELMQQDNLSVDVNDVDDPYDIGDIVGASDNITNIRIAVPVTKKIVSIKNGLVTIDIKTDNANVSAQPTSDYSGGSGTPGADGQDGKDGEDGKDGISCTHSWNGTVLTVTSASGTSSADLKGSTGVAGYTPVKGVDYFDGADGKDGKDGYTPQKGVDYFDGQDGQPGANGQNGVSCTHSWNGTTLTITSASGTSSANLKGDKGDKGDTGTFDSSALANYVTVDGSQTITGAKTFSAPMVINGAETGSGQQAMLKALSTNSANRKAWTGRAMIGAKDLTFLVGTYNGLAAIGAHSWTDAAAGKGAAWAPIYFNPDNSAPLYFGANGTGWTANQGTLKVQGSTTSGAGTVDVYGKLRVNGVEVGGGGTAMTVAQIRAICT